MQCEKRKCDRIYNTSSKLHFVAQTGAGLIPKLEAVRLIILWEKPINPKASQSNRLVLRQIYLSTCHAKVLWNLV